MKLSDDARRLLSAAADVARFRGEPECSCIDVALAWTLRDPETGAVPGLYADSVNSPSPVQMPFAAPLRALLEADAEVTPEHIVGACSEAWSSVTQRLAR